MATAQAAHAPTGPSRWWYALALVCVAAGFVGMGAYMFPRIDTIGDTLVRLLAPGEITLSAAEPGTYTIFHEERSVVDGAAFVSKSVSGLRVSVTSAAGETIPVVPSSTTETYTLGAYAGTSILTFQITEPGSYRVAAAYNDGRTEPRVPLTIGHNFLADLMLTIIVGIGIVFASVVLAAVVIVIVAQKRSKARHAGAAQP